MWDAMGKWEACYLRDRFILRPLFLKMASFSPCPHTASECGRLSLEMYSYSLVLDTCSVLQHYNFRDIGSVWRPRSSLERVSGHMIPFPSFQRLGVLWRIPLWGDLTEWKKLSYLGPLSGVEILNISGLLTMANAMQTDANYNFNFVVQGIVTVFGRAFLKLSWSHLWVTHFKIIIIIEAFFVGLLICSIGRRRIQFYMTSALNYLDCIAFNVRLLTST